MTNQKYIALIDCDSFFVSCERKLNPELKGIPVAVVSGERGCVISRSKEAKMLGLPMGLPLFQAVQRVPECIYKCKPLCLYQNFKTGNEHIKRFQP